MCSSSYNDPAHWNITLFYNIPQWLPGKRVRHNTEFYVVYEEVEVSGHTPQDLLKTYRKKEGG